MFVKWLTVFEARCSACDHFDGFADADVRVDADATSSVVNNFNHDSEMKRVSCDCVREKSKLSVYESVDVLPVFSGTSIKLSIKVKSLEDWWT